VGDGTQQSRLRGSEQPRDRILRAASELFAGEGIRVTGVDALIERAGVAKATFYRHFPSKDELVTAWLRGEEARWIDWVIEQQERSAAPPLRRLVEFWALLGDWMERHDFPGCPFLNTLAEIRDRDHPARREVRSYVGEVEGYLARTATEAGVPEPKDFASRLRFLAMGTCVAFANEGTRAPAATARDATIDLLATRLGTTRQRVEELIGAS
jgi:AcrR family transcriptional regulator